MVSGFRWLVIARMFVCVGAAAIVGCEYRVEHSQKTITASKLRMLNDVVVELNERRVDFTKDTNLDKLLESAVTNKLLTREAVSQRTLDRDGWEQQMILTVTVDETCITVRVTGAHRSTYCGETKIDKVTRKVMSQKVSFR